jgi:hypothetical protein
MSHLKKGNSENEYTYAKAILQVLSELRDLNKKIDYVIEKDREDFYSQTKRKVK